MKLKENETIIINNKIYDIKSADAEELGGVTTWGLFNEKESHILLNTKIDNHLIIESFLHELMHAIDVNYNGCRLMYEQDEGTINSFAAGMYNFFSNNKEFLIDFIREL